MDKTYRYFRSPEGFIFRATFDPRDDQQRIGGRWMPTETKWRIDTYVAAERFGMKEIQFTEGTN